MPKLVPLAIVGIGYMTCVATAAQLSEIVIYVLVPAYFLALIIGLSATNPNG